MRALHLLGLAATGLALMAGRARAQETDLAQWRFESQRPEIAPRSWTDRQVLHDGRATLALAGDGKGFADGRWSRWVPVEPQTHYRFQTYFRGRNVDEPNRSILARVIWQDAKGEVIGQPEYPVTRRSDSRQAWEVIEQTYRSPPGAARAKLELVYRWDADGVVNFGSPVFGKVAAPAPRKVRLATVHYVPTAERSPRENLEEFARLIADAAAQGADIVCLPEALTLPNTGKSYVEASEPLPGPTTEFFSGVARKHGVYIVAGILEREGMVVYNSAILLGRDGKLVGTYRKVSLPREEIDGGVTPGSSFPTFDTDFGRIGLMICWDVQFPEAARQLAMAGAEVILMPIWGGNPLLARARAVENQLYLVSSSYDRPMESGIFDLEGKLLAEASPEHPVVVVEVDLSQKKDWPWLGDFKSRIPREMPVISQRDHDSR